MKEPYSKLDSTQKIVVEVFQQLVTEHTDWLHSLVQCTPPTGYRVHPSASQPLMYSASISRLQIQLAVNRVFNQNIAGKLHQQLVRVYRPDTGHTVYLVTECIDRIPAT